MFCFGQSGIRPFTNPKEEPLTLVVNGVVDDREFQKKGIDQYSDKAARFNELILKHNGKPGKNTCPMVNAGLEGRHGVFGGFVNGKSVVCGGYKLEAKSYLKSCQWLVDPKKPWEPAGDLITGRAYASSIHIMEGPLSGFYVVGGYNSKHGFLDTVGKV